MDRLLLPIVRLSEALSSVLSLSPANTAALRRAFKVAAFAGVYAATVALGQEAIGLESPLKEIVAFAAATVAAALEKRSRP